MVLLAVEPRAAAASASALVPALLAAGSTGVRRLLTEYGFRVSSVDEGLLLRHGLLETRTQTIPAGRVQAVRVIEPWLWRSKGWVRVEVDVAGYAAGRAENGTTSALLPVAPRAVAEQLLARVLPGVDARGPDVAPGPGPGPLARPVAAPTARRRPRRDRAVDTRRAGSPNGSTWSWSRSCRACGWRRAR